MLKLYSKATEEKMKKIKAERTEKLRKALEAFDIPAEVPAVGEKIRVARSIVDDAEPLILEAIVINRSYIDSNTIKIEILRFVQSNRIGTEDYQDHTVFSYNRKTKEWMCGLKNILLVRIP